MSYERLFLLTHLSTGGDELADYFVRATLPEVHLGWADSESAPEANAFSEELLSAFPVAEMLKRRPLSVGF